jgi:hypothetical protein
MKTKSLSFKILSASCFFTGLLGVVVFSVYYVFTRSQIEQAARDNAVLLAENTIKKIEEVIKPASLFHKIWPG